MIRQDNTLQQNAWGQNSSSRRFTSFWSLRGSYLIGQFYGPVFNSLNYFVY